MTDANVPATKPDLNIPVPATALLRIAEEFEQASRLDEAESLLGYILAAAPKQPGALHLMGLVAFRKGRLQESAELVEQAIKGKSEIALYHRNICTIYERLGRYSEAIDAGRKAIALDPRDPYAYHNLSIVYHRLLQLDDSIASAQQAIALHPLLPGPHFALAEAHLLRGEFGKGWEEYEWRFRVPGADPLMPPSDKPQWAGQPMGDDTLLLIADQGFGDVIQFCRYIPWVASRAPHIAVACSRDTWPIVHQVQPGLQLFTDWNKAPPFAAFCPLSGLPRLHGTRLATIPIAGSYLHAEPRKVAAWSRRLGELTPPGYLRVGIAWAGRADHNNDMNRSTSLKAFAPIVVCPRVALISLQKGPPIAHIGAYFGPAPLLNLGVEIADFADTAAIIASLDLVVTVDTAVGHLAAALGKPVWILLPYAPDWRWLLHRSDSPWYPTVRLFRQTRPRCWDDVMVTAASELVRWRDTTSDHLASRQQAHRMEAVPG
jgi:Tfp pilus assembly protein PilF